MTTASVNSSAWPDSRQLQHLLIEIAEAEVLSRYRNPDVSRKSDGTLVTDADLAVQNRLVEQLAVSWPEIPLMGEEMTPQQQQALAARDRYWCVDPLDGTTNYSAGLPYFALSLALVVEGRAVLGIVYDPLRHECYRAELGRGAWLNDEPLRLHQGPGTLKECIAIVDFKRLTPGLAIQLSNHPPYRSQRCFGAIALEWCWLAAGRAHLNLHGGQKLWDYAAGRLIFAEAGGIFSQGARQQERLGLAVQPALGAVDAHLFGLWREWLRQAGFPLEAGG
ncbi:inositol monophosphatase family protein [Sedimenticola hydrogenitrophicus]|uniref:inositol monophosphatase family protein n=1 Tax=Sedimenticola hydrogenitrophicus TaxID=2967975 RepID=UPI0021A7BE82|nr:inositol monophosphatase family protein [Sedimenticola hydrogenitrophicus]